MSTHWTERFQTWSKPPSETEETKAANAARMIREALREFPALADRSFDVYATGSYHNNTNVKLESDIDIAAVLRDVFFWVLPDPADAGLAAHVQSLSDAAYGLTDFYGHVGQALGRQFGAASVRPGNKAFDIRENSYRLNADVAVFTKHRRYSGRRNPDGSWHYHEGVELRPRNAPKTRVINWHVHHYDQGVARNGATRRRFKRVVRILKRLRDHMIESGIPEARAVAARAPSFLIESLVYNALDTCFNLVENEYYEDVKAVVADLWRRTKDDATDSALVEVSEMKWLFAAGQAWSKEDAHGFLSHAWRHVEFT